MGKLGGFLKYQRVEQPERDPRERVGDFREFMGTVECRCSRSRARAAWSAASRSATTAARSGT